MLWATTSLEILFMCKHTHALMSVYVVLMSTQVSQTILQLKEERSIESSKINQNQTTEKPAWKL